VLLPERPYAEASAAAVPHELLVALDAFGGVGASGTNVVAANAPPEHPRLLLCAQPCELLGGSLNLGRHWRLLWLRGSGIMFLSLARFISARALGIGLGAAVVGAAVMATLVVVFSAPPPCAPPPCV